jgi:hypothetical protein
MFAMYVIRFYLMIEGLEIPETPTPRTGKNPRMLETALESSRAAEDTPSLLRDAVYRGNDSRH